MKKKTSRETVFAPTSPIRASQISARVELTPPTSNGTEVEENVTKANIVDLQRYLRWADKAIGTHKSTKRGRSGRTRPKAA